MRSAVGIIGVAATALLVAPGARAGPASSSGQVQVLDPQGGHTWAGRQVGGRAADD